MEFEGWSGRTGSLPEDVLQTLKLTDYSMIYYSDSDGGVVNFYSAYYDSQRKGASAHSPRSCIPGGGWRITSLEDYRIKGVNIGNAPLIVNRLVIERGEDKQLVYYWFQQRSRIVTNEYMMKWYLFWDSLTENRTDGALIRLTTTLSEGQDLKIADDRLGGLARQIAPIIPDYVPQ
jgi:EpsI family protein